MAAVSWARRAHALIRHPWGLGDGRGCVRECAVRVYPVAGDGLGLRAHGVERHGRNSRVRRRAGENRALTVGVVGDRMVVQWRVVAV